MVAYGDIRGFGAWTYRAANTNEVKAPFIRRFYDTLEFYIRRHPEAHFKAQGDGFLIIREFTPKERKAGALMKHLLTLRGLTHRVRADVAACAWPKPEGFRIRITCGDAYKIMMVDPNDPEKKRRIPEYVEYVVNAAQRILMVNPEIVCLVTEGVITALGKGAKAFRVRRLVEPSSYPTGVNKEDIDGLRIVRF